jgi:hypothetical protein
MGNSEFRDGYHRTNDKLVTLSKESKAAKAWASIDGLAFVPPMRMPPLRDGIRGASELKAPAKAEIPSPKQRIIHTTVIPAFIGFRHYPMAVWGSVVSTIRVSTTSDR